MGESNHIIVVGGGHAGIEAAYAAARQSVTTSLITLDPEAVGRMSCNPSIGGLGKGQIVREVDALGGLMGRIADRSAIHYRLLNRSKGPAVQSPRSQNDRTIYAREAKALLLEAGVRIVAGEVADLLSDAGRIRGVRLADGTEVEGTAVILTTGTFLGGVMHCGESREVGGRLGEPAAHALSQRLKDAGFRMGRMKTGTPPRFVAASVNWDVTEPQPSDEDPVRFSFTRQPSLGRTVSCAITRTTVESHAIIAENLRRSPMFSGSITGRGPRYCPSIEDKIHRFPDRSGHQIFLEPEGLDSDLVYPNGISTSLPKDVQESFVRTIPGLERVEFAAFGYAVEYDHIDPTECGPDLHTKRMPGLFLAGQINGTTGYEEAAGQGFVAGVNAARWVRGFPPFVLRRHDAYIGVLLDDLTTRGVEEPYRIFTSLAEHRLILRHQDADLRLLDLAESAGVLDPDEVSRRRQRQARRERARHLLHSQRAGGERIWDLLRRQDYAFDDAVRDHANLESLGLDARDRIELALEAYYDGYVARELDLIERRRESEETPLPKDLDYGRIPHLRGEAREKFQRIRPMTLGQAGRISGIGPADVGALMVHLRTQKAAP